MSLPSISVIIPTYRREAVLRETLASLIQQDYWSYEVLVIDQTAQHEPETQRYLEQLVAEQKIQLFQVSWASLPAARNYGVRRALGEVILFIDDDVQLPSGFLAAHARNYQSSEIGAVAGRVYDRMKLAEAAPGLTIDYLPAEAMSPGVAWYYIDLVHTEQPQQVITARGCNMSFRRALFEQHQLWFDERFQGSAIREESDFCLRIRRTGLKVWYDPEASLIHFGEETGGCHDISTRSLKYQITFYHNNFLMGLKNLRPLELFQLAGKLFYCQVLGNPPCQKDNSPIKIASRTVFYWIGLLAALKTMAQSPWNDGQIYSRADNPMGETGETNVQESHQIQPTGQSNPHAKTELANISQSSL